MTALALRAHAATERLVLHVDFGQLLDQLSKSPCAASRQVEWKPPDQLDVLVDVDILQQILAQFTSGCNAGIDSHPRPLPPDWEHLAEPIHAGGFVLVQNDQMRPNGHVRTSQLDHVLLECHVQKILFPLGRQPGLAPFRPEGGIAIPGFRFNLVKVQVVPAFDDDIGSDEQISRPECPFGNGGPGIGQSSLGICQGLIFVSALDNVLSRVVA